MSPRNPGAEEIEEHAKIFLSCCHRFSRSYYDRPEITFGQEQEISQHHYVWRNNDVVMDQFVGIGRGQVRGVYKS